MDRDRRILGKGRCSSRVNVAILTSIDPILESLGTLSCPISSALDGLSTKI